jgi:hypothetical protein
MAQQIIFIGTIADDNTGTNLRAGGKMINDNFTELYAAEVLNTAKATNATHTGEVTGSTVLTIADKAVTLAKMYDMASGALIYRRSAGVGVPEVNTLAQLAADLGLVGTPIKKYSDTFAHTGGSVQQKVLTGVTTEPYSIMIIDASGYVYNMESFNGELTTILGEYALNLYSVEAINLTVKVLW